MNRATLYQKFDEALTWNGLLFVFNKLIKIFLLFLLYNKLTSEIFSLWANTYSIIYILLLWLDLGFKHSIPLYMPFFSKNSKAKSGFITSIIFFKSLIYVISGTIMYLIGLYMIQMNIFFNLGCILFVCEGIKDILRLIYHSYFWQKRFNLIEGAIVASKMLFILVSVSGLSNSNLILKLIFSIDIAGSMVLIIVSSLMLKSLYSDIDYNNNESLDLVTLKKNFIIHSSVMWGLVSVNSITERNVLTPFIALVLGIEASNIFKIANESALSFQRFVIKTIGTTGTSLFAHIESMVCINGINDVFIKLTKRIIALVLPLSMILWISYLRIKVLSYEKEVFIILAILYLLQTIFMGYERLLEVKRNYRELFISLIPYSFVIGLYVLMYKGIVLINLIQLLLVIHFFRIISLFFRVMYSKKLYSVTFPKRYAFFYSAIVLVSGALIYFISGYLGIHYNRLH